MLSSRLAIRAPRSATCATHHVSRGQTVEDEVLVAFPVLAHGLRWSERKDLGTKLTLNRVLDCAPEVPMQVDAVLVAGGELFQVGGVCGSQRHLPRIDAPNLKHAGIVGQDV